MEFVFQIPSFLMLLAYVVAAIVAGIVGRRRSPKSARLAVAGFCLMVLAFVVSVLHGVFSPSLGAGGGLLVSSCRALVYIGGIVLLVMAVVKKGTDETPTPAGQQHPGQQPQQWQQQWQPPPQQYPGQQPQQWQQQYPRQQ